MLSILLYPIIRKDIVIYDIWMIFKMLTQYRRNIANRYILMSKGIGWNRRSYRRNIANHYILITKVTERQRCCVGMSKPAHRYVSDER